MRHLKERLTFWIAFHLPKDLVTKCFARVVGYATTGKFGNTVLPEITAADALHRWLYNEE